MALYSNTLAVVRHYLSSAVGDLIYGQAGTTGATITKIYAPFLWKANDYYKDEFYEAYVYAGTNIGVTKRVIGWVLTDKLLEIHSAYDAACDASSYVELHRIFSEDELRKAINLTIESLASKYLVEIKDESTISLTSTEDNLGDTVFTYEYALPLSMLYLHRVITEEAVSGVKLTGTVSSGAWTAGETVTQGSATGEFAYDGGTYIRLRKVDGTFTTTGGTATGGDSSETVSSITAVDNEIAGNGRFLDRDEIDPRNWSIIRSYPPKLKLDKRYYGTVNEDLYLRLEGQGTQPVVDDDTDIIYIPPDWLVNKAITFLPGNKIQSNALDDTYRRALIMSADEPRAHPNPITKAVVE